VGATHRMTRSPEPRLPGSARRKISRSTLTFGVAPMAVLCVVSLAVLLLDALESVGPAGNPPKIIQGQLHDAKPVSQEGTVVAVSADAVTARSADGYTQTYRVTPDTTVVTGGGGKRVTVTAHFEIDEQVDIVGTVQGGTVLATAVSERTLGHGDGPPMDNVEGQSVIAVSAHP
jgi:hypothetical protein